MIGAEPCTEWLHNRICLDERGFVLTDRDIPHRAWPLKRAPLPFETSLPGVFAVGDVRHGSIKRVAGAVGRQQRQSAHPPHGLTPDGARQAGAAGRRLLQYPLPRHHYRRSQSKAR